MAEIIHENSITKALLLPHMDTYISTADDGKLISWEKNFQFPKQVNDHTLETAPFQEVSL